MAIKQITKENALMRLEALCARSERCSYEALTKLRQWGITAKDAEEIINELVDNRFIDDRRFARAYAVDKVRFGGQGRMKIRMSLIAKRIDRETINEALEVIDEEEYVARLDALAAAKAARTVDADTYEGSTKIYRFLLTRGFESPLVARAMRKLRKGTD